MADAQTQADLQRVLLRAARFSGTPEPITPSQIVFETDNGTVHRYGHPDHPPILIIYSLVNRPAILDLSAERSVIGKLVAGGFCVYLLNWHPPGIARRYTTLADYIRGDIADAVRWVDSQHSIAPHLLGVCQGGVLALCHAALAADATAAVASVITLATPVDTGSKDDQLARLARGIDFEQLIHATGNIAGQGLASVFAALKPFALGPQRYGALPALAEADDEALETFMRMERWMYDGPDLAGQAFAEFAAEIYQRNTLARGELLLDGKQVDLAAIHCPVFNVWAEHDHLVPPAAANGLEQHVSGPCTNMALPGGHLGLFIGARAHRTLYPALIDWLNGQAS